MFGWIKKNRIIFLFAIYIIFLFIGSEIVYNLNNHTQKVTDVYILSAEKCAKFQWYRCSSLFLEMAARNSYFFYDSLHPGLMDKIMDFDVAEGTLAENIRSTPSLLSVSPTLTFYYLGLNAYKSGDTGAALDFWQKAIFINPDLAHTYVELSNLYLRLGNAEMARQVLDRCVKFNDPQTTCRVFLAQEARSDFYEDPGFLESEILRLFRK
jgi:tetratricopeptide (TPR) repeat protein